MADVTTTYGIDVESNADKAAQGFKLLSSAIDGFTSSGEHSTSTINGMWKGLNRLETTFGRAPSTVNKYSDAFSNLRKEVSAAEKAMQSYAQKRVVAGSRDPAGLSANRMSLSDAQRNLATSSASNLSIDAVSRERVNLENRLNAAKREGASLDQQMKNLGRDQVRVAKEKLDAANQELRAAQVRSSSGKGSGAVPYNISEQVRIEERLADAKKGVYRAQVDLNRATESGAANLPTLRYAMYDVARTAGVMSAAITGAGVGLLAASSSYETSFTAVERTSGVTGAAVGDLRDDLLGLARVIPQSFGEISDLAARGAQLGVASDNLAGFTETVAQFVATSDTVSLDQAVEAFGRISNLTGDSNFNALGSAITLVGVNAAATEGQIVKTTQELAPFAASVGMASYDVVGLATAVASLGQPAERSRSAFLSLQSVMDGAIGGTNDKLAVFANLLGVTETEAAKLWKTDPSAFISAMASALSGVDNMSGALSELGLSEKRASQVFQALAADSRNAGDGLSVLDQALTDSEKGYKDGTELARQYGLIVDDLASKWQIFLNSAMELASALGDNLAPAAKAALDIITPFVQALSNAARTPFVGVLAKVGAGLVALVGVLLTGVTAWALTTAAAAGLSTAIQQLGANGGITSLSLRGLTASLTATASAAGISTTAINGFRVALASTGIGLAVVALGTLVTAFATAGESADAAFSRFTGASSGLTDAIALDTKNYLEGLEGAYTVLTPVLDANSTAIDENAEAIRGAATVLGLTPPAVDASSDAVERNTQVLGDNAIAWLQNSLMQSEAFQEITKDPEFVNYWSQIGADFAEVTRIAAADGEAAVLEYFLRLETAYEEGQKRLGRAVTTTQGAFNSTGSLQAGWMGGRGMSGGMFGTDTGKGINDIAKFLGGASNQMRIFGTATKGAAEAVDDANDSVEAGTGAVGGYGNAAKEAAEKVRTLKDYASDLKGVWDRAFEIRFSGQQTLDAVRDSIQKLRDAAEASAKRVTDLRNSIRSLSADSQALKSDISILEYYLRIAREYGDTKRATALEAELAKKRADLADKTSELADKNKELKKEQSSQNKTLTGNTQAARDNRKSLLDLVQQYQSHIEALAKSGMSQKDLSAATQRLKDDFMKQATQLGYNRDEVKRYAASFDDVAVAIAKVPRNVTIEVKGINPAVAALREVEAAAKRANTQAGNLRNTLGKGLSAGGVNTSSITAAGYAAEAATLRKKLMDAAFAPTKAGKGNALAPYTETGLRSRLSQLSSMGYMNGGFTGRGPRDEIKGTVHGGEYVFRKDQVNQSTGMPTQAALLSMLPQGSLPSRSVAPAAPAGRGGPAQVSLTAGTIQAIAQAVDKNLVVDGKLVAEATTRAFAYENTTGAY